eukprot:835686_1
MANSDFKSHPCLQSYPNDDISQSSQSSCDWRFTTIPSSIPIDQVSKCSSESFANSLFQLPPDNRCPSLDHWIAQYKLNPLATQIKKEGLSLHFLLSQKQMDLVEIAEELSPSSTLQKQKLLYAIKRQQEAWQRWQDLSRTQLRQILNERVMHSHQRQSIWDKSDIIAQKKSWYLAIIIIRSIINIVHVLCVWKWHQTKMLCV